MRRRVSGRPLRSPRFRKFRKRRLVRSRPRLSACASSRTPSSTRCAWARNDCKPQYGIDAVPLQSYRERAEKASRGRAIVLKVLGKGIDAFRTAAWTRRHDVVIVPGMGVLETSLPAASHADSLRTVPSLCFGPALRDQGRLGERGRHHDQAAAHAMAVRLGRPSRVLPVLSRRPLARGDAATWRVPAGRPCVPGSGVRPPGQRRAAAATPARSASA